jgi:hypothetical protein
MHETSSTITGLTDIVFGVKARLEDIWAILSNPKPNLSDFNKLSISSSDS